MKKHILILCAAAACLLSACGKLQVELIEPDNTAHSAEQTQQIQEILPEIIISELMTNNKAAVPGENGTYPDWVELYNAGDAAAELGGFALSDGSKRQALSEGTSLGAGEYLLLYCTDFSLKAGESLSLISPGGAAVTELVCPELEKDMSFALNASGEYTATALYSPGAENTEAAYLAFAASLEVPEGLIINEVCVSNLNDLPTRKGDYYDWIELKNNSDAEISLCNFYLSDKLSEAWQLPDVSLAQGETALVYCSKDGEGLPFGLDSRHDDLYLKNSEGEIIDRLALQNVPVGGSIGRLDGEKGFFYFSVPSPLCENSGGNRLVTEPVTASLAPGVYDGVEGLTLELSADGDIYYTTDGSLPGTESALYTEPIYFTENLVLRAIAVKENACPSRTETFSYIVNQYHELPVVSIAVDKPKSFTDMYWNLNKAVELSASFTLFDGDNTVDANCGLRMKGKTSLGMPKKSMGVYFRGRYGDGDLSYDLFGDGICEFGSLSVRAGQDYTTAIIRNELCQDLANEYSDVLPGQRSRYCALYINGSYWGLYCLKDNINEQYYASRTGLSEESISMVNGPAALSSDFYQEVLIPGMKLDLSVDENYRVIEEKLNIDAFIDWVLFEGWSGNTDTQGNVKFVRSTEDDGKWVPIFYDLDWALRYTVCQFYAMAGKAGNCGVEVPWLLRNLMFNPEFRDKLLSRYAELAAGALSNENVLSKIDSMAAEIDSEVQKDRQRWSMSYDSWLTELDALRGLLYDGWLQSSIDKLISAFDLGTNVRADYFGY